VLILKGVALHQKVRGPVLRKRPLARLLTFQALANGRRFSQSESRNR
jgi:hypothetical protein